MGQSPVDSTTTARPSSPPQAPPEPEPVPSDVKPAGTPPVPPALTDFTAGGLQSGPSAHFSASLLSGVDFAAGGSSLLAGSGVDFASAGPSLLAGSGVDFASAGPSLLAGSSVDFASAGLGLEQATAGPGLLAATGPQNPTPEAAAKGRFLRTLPPGPLGAAWQQAYTYTERYHQDCVDLPFPYMATDRGCLELNDQVSTVRGLQALGATEAARGVLENWLTMGERYGVLPGSNKLNELGRSGMPRLSGLLLEESGRNPDPSFLERSYNVLVDDWDNNWNDGYFKRTPGGLNRFCDVDYSPEATLEESGGAKNAERFEHANPLDYQPVDLNAWLYRTEKDMQAMAERLAQNGGPQAEDWKTQAAQWGERAAQRKAALLQATWNPDQNFFFDVKYREGKQSEVRSLAPYSLLTAGVLDPSNPQEKAMVEALVAALPGFGQPPEWDDRSHQAAPPQDVLDLAAGLDRYGYTGQAEGLRSQLQARLDGSPPGGLSELGVRAQLSPQRPVAPPPSGMSPLGERRLERFQLERPAPSEAGRVDRRLRQLHPSMLEPELVGDLRERGLQDLVLNGPSPDLQTRPAGQALQLGPLHLDLGIPGLQVGQADPGAIVLQREGQSLVVAVSGKALIVGDRAYYFNELPTGEDGQPRVELPRTLLQSFQRSGGNPQLEAFADHFREWLGPLREGPAAEVAPLAGRPGWNRLLDKTREGWSQLTIDPSVVARDTASPIFNRAAVPSLGIFKTQFNWDTLFMSKGMRLQGQSETVAGMADNLLYLLSTTGRVPNAARSVYLNKSQPPILPGLVRMSLDARDQRDGSEDTTRWLGAAYQAMGTDYNKFWGRVGEGERGISEIDGQLVTLSRWGGANHKFAMDESGLDTTSRLYGKALDLVQPEPNCFLYQYANDMSAIASELADRAAREGRPAEANRLRMDVLRWKGEADTRKQDLIKFCWDEQDGMFRDYRYQGEPKGLVRDQAGLSAVAMPLWVGMLDPHDPKENEMIRRSLDNLERLFERPHGLTSTAEDYGHPEMQWNAPSGWAPHHMMAIEGAARCGDYTRASRWLEKWLDTLDHVYSRDGVIIERYNMETGDHPPVQKGRYEETQGAGPGFGWTNATVPWGMVEMLAGLHVDEQKLRLEPLIPKGLEGQPVKADYPDPKLEVEHRYTSGKGYQCQLGGELGKLKQLEVVTPPLPAGLVPRISGADYSIREEKDLEGQTRYHVSLENVRGPVSLAWGPEPG